MNKKKSNFSGQLGFVLAAAGSAVGVGNLWRFPYLAAKDGGGLFLVIYLALVLTFGFTLLASDIAIGRRTKESAIGAYTQMSPKWKFLGILTFLVPVLIMTYYAVIGGWVTKYAVCLSHRTDCRCCPRTIILPHLSLHLYHQSCLPFYLWV